MASASASTNTSGEYLYEYHGLKLIVLAAFFIPLEIIFVLLRTWSRTLLKKKGVNVETPPCDISNSSALELVSKGNGLSLPPIAWCIQSPCF
jgi:hypothetical protein